MRELWAKGDRGWFWGGAVCSGNGHSSVQKTQVTWNLSKKELHSLHCTDDLKRGQQDSGYPPSQIDPQRMTNQGSNGTFGEKPLFSLIKYEIISLFDVIGLGELLYFEAWLFNKCT